MNCRDEIIKIIDECLEEVFKGETLGEDDKLDLDILRESLIAKLSKDMASSGEEQFFLDNIDLYRGIIKALLSGNEKEVKIIGLELLKRVNNRDNSTKLAQD